MRGIEEQVLLKLRRKKSGGSEFKLSSHAERALALSAWEARRLGLDYMDTESLLLGLLCMQDSLAAEVLHRLGLSLKQARAQVVRHLSTT